MTSAKLNIEIDVGATFEKRLTWKAGKPAVPVNLTGCTARLQMRERADAPLALLTLTTDNAGLVLGGAAGTVSILISAAKTAALLKRSAVYDLYIKFPDGTVRKLLSGSVTISLGVTRD